MIRYVPITDHGFAFLDTVTMRFVEVEGDQVFSGVGALREAVADNDSARERTARHGKARGLDAITTRRLIEMAEVGVTGRAVVLYPDDLATLRSGLMAARTGSTLDAEGRTSVGKLLDGTFDLDD